MSLCRYLPVPSDRMAIMWTLLGVEDGIVLEYGPAGTTHYCVSLFAQMGISPDQNLFTTHMSEDDVIMGDVTRLENAICEIDEGYHPRVIFVIASAVTSVIGTDLAGVCKYMQSQVSARLIPVENGGFSGDYTLGLSKIYTLLVRELAGAKAQSVPHKLTANEMSADKKTAGDRGGSETRKPGTYNVLGASAGAYRISSDLWEIEDLMRRAFGLTRGAVLGVHSSLDQLSAMGTAQVNLVLRREALEAARYLWEVYGVPYVYGAPYGYEGTQKWLEETAKAVGYEMSLEVKTWLDARKSQAATFRMYASMYAARPHQPSAAIIGDFDTILGFSSICRELEIKPDLCICPHTLKNTDIPEDLDIRHPASEKEQIRWLKSLEYHLVFGDDVSLHLCGGTNTGLCVSFPLVSHVQTAEHLPFMGIRGMDFILETVDRYYQVLE
ncbi:nitrogenase molybdenum-cofactor synthesis protein NifE [Catenibacillus scindens]|uniref:Nitrogenase molybdenum-cofactor synthesis protein NifE n=1 Tax=Catenibacillus scindens TaxID=673271 RepID=A0A7W8HB73_9FIRM|nr:nitrogenase component 1 [Catenibacillus scindens]MBB5265244.1 nitrogenase molybdenum-cofactor synthesis protein NifE [Catenibacillus scindens]